MSSSDISRMLSSSNSSPVASPRKPQVSSSSRVFMYCSCMTLVTGSTGAAWNISFSDTVSETVLTKSVQFLRERSQHSMRNFCVACTSGSDGSTQLEDSSSVFTRPRTLPIATLEPPLMPRFWWNWERYSSMDPWSSA